MRGSGRKYGVQVGNETYSLIMTQEDWEKRRLDREHARKLSLATNKRRRALDDRKRLAEMRENRKRELELFKRRQRQIEATERYQRFHLNVKDRRDRTAEMTQATPNLELVLQRLRGGDGDGYTPPAYEMLPPPMQDKNLLYSDADPKLQQRAKWSTMKEYSSELNRDILGLKHIEGDPVSKEDSYLPEDNDDGQDSLHGSTISGSSSQPSLSSVNCANDTNTVNTSLLYKENSPVANSNRVTISQPHVDEKQRSMEMRVPDASGNFSPSSGSGVLCKRDGQTGKITYYVKAYRPWSAGVTNKPQMIFNRPSEALRIRPSSSYETRRSTLNDTSENTQKQHDTWTNAGYVVHNKQTRISNTQPKPVVASQRVTTTAATSYIDIKPNQTRALMLGKTTATPVSPFFGSNENKSAGANVAHSVNATHTKQNIPDKSVAPTHKSNEQILENTIATVTPESKEAVNDAPSANKKDGALKGILRRYSKYDTSPIPQYTNIYPQPAYQSAGLARQKWLHGINFGPKSPVDSETNKEPRARSAEAKSVRWHQVQYNDGTSSALDGKTEHPIPQPPSMPLRNTQITTASPRGVKSPKKSVASRPKTSPPRTVNKGGKGKGGRKLRVAKETPVDITPHPPPQKTSPKLSMSTVINYSIDPTEETKQQNGAVKSPGTTVTKKAIVRNRQNSGNKRASPVSHNKILFHRKVKPDADVVTMSTLKSSGTDTQQPATNDVGNVVVNEGNQVTISVSSSKPISYGSDNIRRGSSDVAGRIPLNGTPTDQEIDLLWDKVRAYLAWNKNRNTPPATKKYRSPAERKIAWGSSQPEPSTKHISANIISIDGGIFSKNSHSDETYNTDNQPYNKHSQQIAAQMERYGISKSRKVANSYSPAMQVYDFNNYVSPYQRQEKARGTIPVVTNGHPSSAPVRRQPQLTESVKTFRLVEALIEQNVPEEQILKALNSLQTATREV